MRIMSNVTETKMTAIPTAGRRVRVSPNTSMPSSTAVRGSKAPKMAVVVLPTAAMACEVK